MSRPVEIVGVPMDLGGNRRGVDMGPSAIRYADLHRRLERLGITVRDRGNLKVADRAEGLVSGGDTRVDESNARSRHRAHHVEEIVRVMTELASQVEAVARAGEIPIVLGGDHSIAIGTLAGLRKAGRRPGVIWIDAHGDINTPGSTPSGNVHGMPLAVAVGLASEPFPAELRGSVDGATSVLLATRSVDAGERDNIRRAGVTALTMADIDRLGMAAAMEKAIAVASKGQGIHLSLDMDAIDPDDAPGVGTPVRGGLTYREAQLAMEMLAASGQLRSIEVAEVNPILDTGNRTAQLAVELIASALGQTIL
ncbi:MAG TPA: arginase [Candidatus Limnocylindria bacterium]|nr:arginase [Candidatus Limnocylindria bacterium]